MLESIRTFIANPSPVWENTLTPKLVTSEWSSTLTSGLISSKTEYNSATAFLKYRVDTETIQYSAMSPEFDLRLEIPSPQFAPFIEEHGLQVMDYDNITNPKSYNSLSGGLNLISKIATCRDAISTLISTIVLLRQDNPEYDISYTHPQIPFTIFVSASSDDSIQSCLRCAESIIHEAMHLKLSLIEKHVRLVNSDANNLYYSPWRDELRPPQGIMHGIFVFKAVQEFYQAIISHVSNKDMDFCSYRIGQIRDDLKMISDFPYANDLTPEGLSLVQGIMN